MVYDLVNPNNLSDNTVKVSSQNASIFLSRGVAVTIPKTLTDHSSTASDREKVYQVVGIVANAFQNTAITSLTIEAEVPEIPGYLCSGCKALTLVSFPSSVTKIGSYAFAECAALTEATTLESVTEINSNAFQNCTSLASVTFSDNLLTIGSTAFSGCTLLTTVDIPASVKTLSTSVFKGCTALETVTFHDGNLERIQQSCFEGCTALKAPDFPPSVKQLDNYVFKNCISLGELSISGIRTMYSNVFEGAHITKITWPTERMTYCATYIFKSVTGLTEVDVPDIFPNHAIPSWTFSSCPDLVKVNLQDGFKTINEGAFQLCDALTTVTMPESLDEIQRNSFQKCKKLTGVDFPSSMTFIRQDAFVDCSSLGDITIPADVKLESGAFRGTMLTSITWPKTPTGTIDGYAFGWDQDVIETMYFPSWMERIPENLCGGWENLKSVTIHDGVKTVGANAFANCTALTSVDFGNTLEVIENQGFVNCRMTEIKLPDTLREINSGAFRSNGNLQSVEFPEGLQVLGANAFHVCKGLTTVKFKGGPSAIGMDAFRECDKLETAYLPPRLTEIGDRAFYQCGKLKYMKENPQGTELDSEFPESLVKIGVYAFANCYALDKIRILKGMTIGDYAFSQCNFSEIFFPDEPCTFGSGVFFSNSKITEITLPAWMIELPVGICQSWSKLETVVLSGAVTKIGDSAFQSCSKLHDFPWPKTLKEIGKSAFNSCNNWSPYFGPVTLYDGIIIGDNAFNSATVTEIIFNGCAEIGTDSFRNNTRITKIAFPDCMEEIPAGFCNTWSNLTDVVLPSKLKVIGKDAFSECIRLTNIRCPEDNDSTVFHLPATLEAVGAGAFYNCDKLTEINLPDQPVKYEGSSYHGVFNDCEGITKVTIPASMTEIPERFFYTCRNLTEIEFLPRDGAPLEIGNTAFSACYKLPIIKFPDTEITLKKDCFASCSALEQIVWPENHTLTLGNGCFKNCANLTEVSFPDYITEIPEAAFQSCSKLATVNLNGLETSIGNSAFAYCAIENLSWAKEGRTPVLSILNNNVFQANKLKEVTIPGCVKEINQSCFYGSSELEKVTLEEGVTTLWGAYTFGYCPKLKEINFPRSLVRIGGQCFTSDTALEKVVLNEGLKNLDFKAFDRCSALREIEISSTVTSVGSECFKDCTSLENVLSHAEDVSFSTNVFKDLKNLKTFTSTGHIVQLSDNCFDGCTSLTDFTMTGEKNWVDNIGQYVFQNCSSLKAFLWLKETTYIGSCAFKGCATLREITMPENPQYHSNRNNRAVDMQFFNGDTALETITFPCRTTPYFALSAADIADCPLTAVSYSYADNIVPQGKPNPTIKKYTNSSNYNVTNPENSILYVKRNQRWKYVEADYDKVFNIIEMKEPQINIEGDIFSDYIDDRNDEHYNCNKYKVILRWMLPLSDLNANDSTVAHLYRDGEKVADIVFGKPSAPKTISKDDDPAAPTVPVIEVPYTVNGKVTTFSGDFDFLAETQTDGTPIYEMRYGLQNKSLYYDARSHKMLNAMDIKSFEPWFTFVDEFYSKPLDEADAKESFVYTATIEPYDYTEYANNEGLVAGEDGKLYHETTVRFDGGETEGVAIHTAMASLKLDFTHLYSEEQIREDIDQHLAVTNMADRLKDKAKMTYTLDKDLVLQKGRYTKDGRLTTDNIITAVDLRERQEDGSFKSVLTSKNGHAVNRAATGTINLYTEVARDYVLEPGKTYQLITYSLFRGEFGSRTITIPDIPQLKCTLDLKVTDHAMADPNGHTWIPFNALLSVTPDATPTGHTTAKPADGDWYLGIWRTIENDPTRFSETKPGMQRDVENPTFVQKTVVHHADGHVEGNSGSDCVKCRETINVNQDETSLNLTDLFDHGAHPFKAIYDTRLYVKVPEKMLNTPDRWMAVDLQPTIIKENFTDIEEIDAGDTDVNDVYYDMQGRIVAHPEPGDILIRVRGNVISKIRIR